MPGTSQVGLFITQRASENLHAPCGALCGIFMISLSLSLSLSLSVLIHVHYIENIYFSLSLYWKENIIQNHFFRKLVNHGGLEQNEGE